MLPTIRPLIRGGCQGSREFAPCRLAPPIASSALFTPRHRLPPARTEAESAIFLPQLGARTDGPVDRSFWLARQTAAMVQLEAHWHNSVAYRYHWTNEAKSFSTSSKKSTRSRGPRLPRLHC